MSCEPDVAVLYVARGDAGAGERISAFAAAYLAHPADWQHELIFLAKGWSNEAHLSSVRDDVGRSGARVVELPDDGFDWAAYFRAAPLLTQPWLCLMNSHTRPCVPDWLALLMTTALGQKPGLVGATASWESSRWHWVRRSSPMATLRGIAHNCRHSNHLRGFGGFPNPHVRSTALIIPWSLFLDFAASRDHPANKSEAHALESGKSGLSSFILDMGQTLSVVGSDSRCYVPEEWPDSATFRSRNQTNLICRDNWTYGYDAADLATRRHLEILAWGEPRS